MTVGPDEVRRIAELVSLEVPDADLADLVRDLSRILEYIGELERAGTAAAPPFRPGPPRMPLRADSVGSVALQIPLEHLAPDFRDGFFIVPRVEGVGDEG